MDKPLKDFEYMAPVFRVDDLGRSLAFYREQPGFYASDFRTFDLPEALFTGRPGQLRCQN